MTLPMFVATLTSNWYGGIFGVTQISFEHGIYGFFSQGLVWYIAYLIFAFFILRKIWGKESISIPELIQLQYGKKSQKVAIAIMLLKVLPVTYAMCIGVFIQEIFNISLNTAIISSCTFVALYSCIGGGLRGLIARDLVQFISMYIAVISVIITSYITFGGFDYLRNNLPNTYFQITGNHNYILIITWLLIALITTLIHPVFYQRCISAKSYAIAKKGVLISMLFWFVFDCCTVLGGMYAKATLPNANSIHAYLSYGMQILPNGFKGLFLAGIASTILSTLDAFLFISASLIAYDAVPILLRKSNTFRNFTIIMCAALAAFIALNLEHNMEKIMLILESYAGAPLVFPMLYKYFTRSNRINDNHCCASFFVTICAISILHFYTGNIQEGFIFGIAISGMYFLMINYLKSTKSSQYEL